MIFGKLIGALLGLLTFGWIGALLGLAAGHWFDRGLRHSMGFDVGARRAQIERSFFETAFRLMGHLAKADGRVSEAEIAGAEAIMARLGLDAEHRKEAIGLFKEGVAGDIEVEAQLSAFLQLTGNNRLLRSSLLEILIGMAFADGELHADERRLLQRIAGYLGVNPAALARLLDMFSAQSRFHGQHAAASHQDQLADAYKALGVDAGVSDAQLKRAYRKLMSEHHPDKLIARGVPEDMLKLATEKSQEIQSAYELVRKARAA